MTQQRIYERTSEILAKVITEQKGDGDISVGKILELLGNKSFCLAILVLAIPNCFPIPNVLAYSAFTGIPIIFLSIQMVIGRKTPWMPGAISNYCFSRTKYTNFLTKVLPYIKKIERLFYPRMFFININVAERLVGIAFLLLGIILSLPIPFGNLPPGFAIVLIAIGLMERDGLMITAGVLFGIISCIAIFAAIKVVLITLIGNVF
jgi:hypothetical protein